MVAETGPSEPLFGIIVGCFFMASTIVTLWLLFGSPRARRNPDSTTRSPSAS
jgi:hypothetical protein